MGRSLMNVTVCESHRACFLLLFLLQHCWTFYFLHFPSEQFRSWTLSGTSSSCVKPPAGLSLSLSFFPHLFLIVCFYLDFVFCDVQACFQLVVRNVDDEVDRGRPVQLQLVESEDMCFSSSAPSALTAHRSSEDDR